MALSTKGNCWVMLGTERELFKSDNGIWFWTYLMLFLGKIVRSGDYFIFLKQPTQEGPLISGADNVPSFSELPDRRESACTQNRKWREVVWLSRPLSCVTPMAHCFHQQMALIVWTAFFLFGSSRSSGISEKNSPATRPPRYTGASELNVKGIKWSIGGPFIRSDLIPQI